MLDGGFLDSEALGCQWSKCKPYFPKDHGTASETIKCLDTMEKALGSPHQAP